MDVGFFFYFETAVLTVAKNYSGADCVYGEGRKEMEEKKKHFYQAEVKLKSFMQMLQPTVHTPRT